MPIIECQECGETSDLTGRRVGSTIEISCDRCNHSWMRDTEPTCPTCGSSDVRPFKEPLVQRARGTAYSIVGQKTIYLCERCDANEIRRRTPEPDAPPAPREDLWK